MVCEMLLSVHSLVVFCLRVATTTCCCWLVAPWLISSPSSCSSCSSSAPQPPAEGVGLGGGSLPGGSGPNG